MAKVELQKIRVVGLKGHYEVLMKELQRKGVMHIKNNPNFFEESKDPLMPSRVDDFDLANVEFAINFLAPYAPTKGKMESILTGGKLIMTEKEAREKFEKIEPKLSNIIKECGELEEGFVRSNNEILQNNKKIAKLENFAEYRYEIGKNMETEKTKTVVGKISANRKKDFLEKIARKTNLVDIEIFNANKRDVYFRLTYVKDFVSEIESILSQYNFQELDLSVDFAEFSGEKPADVILHLKEKNQELKKGIKDGEKRRKELAKGLDDLKLAYDFYTWRRDKDEVKKNVYASERLFAFEAWMPKNKYSAMEHWIKQVFVGEVIIEKIQKEKDEKEPSLLKNSGPAKSFELITEMYGSPSEQDIDPTPGLTPFFIAFFGICLSDTGYGLILFLIASFFLLFGKFSKEARTSLWMIFFLGVSAFIGGVLLGGHFGMTPEQAPAFLTTINSAGETVFRGQILDPMKGTGAMTFLLATFAIGLIQLLFGLVMDFIKNISLKKYVAAFADSAAWFFFILFLTGWALADKVGLPKNIMYYLLLTMTGVLVLTQGREKTHKNPIVAIILKLVFGILGLYGIMDYVSNMLSYSRLMALGLSTGIIGAAMNMTAAVLGDMIPGAVGIIVMIAFLIFGHSINFGLSTMGAFIHTMRLQFIEFFGVFYNGGAEAFKPFARIKKYLLFRS